MDEVTENVLGHMALAREYFDAVGTLNVGTRFTSPDALRPMLQMLGIGLEVAMKSDLLLSGMSEDNLKNKFGHRFSKLYANIDDNRRDCAQKTADRVYIAKLRGWRDEYEGSLHLVVKKTDEIPTNDDIGKSIPKAQDLMDRFAPLYASNKGLRYFVSFFHSSARLPFPPHSDIPALFRSIWGEAFLDCMDRKVRQNLKGAENA